MLPLARRIACALTLVTAIVFVMSDGGMHIEDPLRPGVPSQILRSTAGPCAALAEKATEQRQLPDTDTPPVVASSLLVCELGDTAVFSGALRFCGHVVTNESTSGRAFNPCAPARAGPKPL